MKKDVRKKWGCLFARKNIKEHGSIWGEADYIFRRAWEFENAFGRYKFKIAWKSKSNITGRFGGGWNWELGIRWGSNDVIINLLVLSLRLTRKPPITGKGEK